MRNRRILNFRQVVIVFGIVVILCGFLGSGCRHAMTYVHPDVDFSYIKRVAVAPLVNLTNDKFAGTKVMNVVATDILRRGVFDVVEFGEVTRVFREEGLRDPEMLGKDLLARAGRRLKIEAVIAGSVMEYGASRAAGSSFPEVSVSLKLVDVQTYQILWETTHNVKGSGLMDQLFGLRKKSSEDLCREVVSDIFDTLFG